MKSIQLGVLFLVLRAPQLFADDFHGRVVSESGQPLADVLVLDMPYQETRTDAAGRFTLQVTPRGTLKIVDTEKAVRFTHAGYKPSTRVLKMNDESEIVLNRGEGALWTPKACTAEAATLRGDVMAFRSPAGAQVVRTEDIDYRMVSIQSGNDTARLGWGALWSRGIPGPSFFSGISQLEERTLVLADNVTVAEYKGTRTDGTYFRYIGMFGETVTYDGASKQSADYFDRILDSICWTRIPSSTRPPR